VVKKCKKAKEAMREEELAAKSRNIQVRFAVAVKSSGKSTAENRRISCGKL